MVGSVERGVPDPDVAQGIPLVSLMILLLLLVVLRVLILIAVGVSCVGMLIHTLGPLA